MLAVTAAATINHLLQAAPWALERLAPHAGKTVHVACGLINLRFSVEASGEVRAATSEASEDLTLMLPTPLLLRALAQGRTALNEAQMTGDTSFAQALAYVAQHLEWDYEEDLSKVVGDIAAHRIGATARGAVAWGQKSVDSLQIMLRDYLTEERPVLAKPREVAEFITSVDELRDAAARLEKRIELLQEKKST
ncbi:MAG: sterol-binding protein [Burkholderiales bacterium]